MHKKDLPMALGLSLAVIVGALAFEGYTPHVAPLATTSFTDQRAAVARVYQSVAASPTTRASLMALEKSQKGTQQSVSGTIEAYYKENKKFVGTDQPLSFALVSGKNVYEIQNLRGQLPPRVDGASVTLSGLVATRGNKRELTVDLGPGEIRSMKGRPAGGRSENLSNCLGAPCTLVVPLDMSGGGEGVPTPEEIEAYIFSGRIKDALAEESYGQVVISGRVLPWLVLPAQTISLFYAPYEVEQHLLQNGIDLSTYKQLVFLVRGGSQGAGGEATIGAATYWANGTVYTMPTAVVGFSAYANNAELTTSNGSLSYFDYLYIHETGHNMHALHDNLLTCKSGPLSLPSECLSVEYGNKYSIMGDGAYGGHFSLLQKLRAGWVNAPTLSHAGNYPMTALESAPGTFLGIDGNGNQIPEFLLERRSSTGLDSLDLFTGLNLDGTFLYRMKNGMDANVTVDPMTWDLSLVDTTPAARSTEWHTSMSDVVFKTPQRYNDLQHAVRFAHTTNGSTNPILVSVSSEPAACVKNPIKIFEPYVNPGDTFPGQLLPHAWPATRPAPFAIPEVHADVNDPGAQAFIYKSFMLFNDDAVPCGAGQYQMEFVFNGQSVPLLTEAVASYGAWSGPHFGSMMAYLPVQGMAYGQHVMTMKITKQSDGSVFTKDLTFNLVP